VSVPGKGLIVSGSQASSGVVCSVQIAFDGSTGFG
jgi:hypothetical protein